MSDDMLTVQAVAARLGLSAKTIRNYRDQGRLPPPDGVLGNRPWWRPETIDAWQAARPGRGVGGGRPRKRPTREEEAK